MNDLAEIAKLSLILENRLSDQGILDKEKLVIIALPAELHEKIDGLVDNTAELEGLLRIGAAARRGEVFSEPVAAAARMMLEEVCQAIFDSGELSSSRRLH